MARIFRIIKNCERLTPIDTEDEVVTEHWDATIKYRINEPRGYVRIGIGTGSNVDPDEDDNTAQNFQKEDLDEFINLLTALRDAL